MRRFAVQRRCDILAAGQQQAVEAVERVGDLHGRLEDADFAAGMEDRLPVVLQLAARRDSNQWHEHQRRYIRVGTSIPIRSSARVSCDRK